MYTAGSIPATINSLPKLREILDFVPAFRLRLQSIWAYNYRLAKLLGKLVDDNIPSNNSAKDTFCIVEELKMATVTKKCMVSCDATSWFTN